MIAQEAIHVEQNLLEETVGLQDQIQCCYGGFNIIRIGKDGEFNVINLSKDNRIIQEIERSLVLVYSNIQRISSIEQENAINSTIEMKAKIEYSREEIHEISNYCSRLFLEDNMTMDIFCELVQKSWEAKKRSLPSTANNERIIEIYNQADASGSRAGKCLGAGGGRGSWHFLWILKSNLDSRKR